MDNRQKKIIIQFGNILLVLISISLIVIGFIYRDHIYLSVIGGLLNPSTIIGTWIKVYINKKHKKEIQEIVKDIPKPIEEIPEPIRDPKITGY